MAEGLVVGAFVTASVQVLLDTIVSRDLVDFFCSKKLDVSLLDKLETTLLSLEAVLNDAEEKQIKNPAIKEWLQKLRDAVFEADSMFDEINTKALQQKVKAQFLRQTATNKVRNILSSPFKWSYGEINSKMQKLFETLEHFSQKGQLLGLRGGVSNNALHVAPTSSLVDESTIYGRNHDKQKLKDYLLSRDASDGGSKIGVISIWGMGGVGKTTLAGLLYHDPELKDKFDLKGWAYISKDFDVYRVTKMLLESVTSKATDDTKILNFQQLEFANFKASDTNNLNTLQVELQQSLSNKRFLLVLDDVWDGNYVEWNNLNNIFNVGKEGSRIIITTRHERVALAMQTFLPIHHLEPLQSEDCWSLLAKHAFGASNNREKSHLEVIGKEIAKKCDGLPLAAVALGGLLRTKLSQLHWNKVLKSNIWDLENVGVQPALLLSYHYLPSHLKGCFAYCSIFPKNSMLEKEMVVQLWIAQGLVRQSKVDRSMEEEGCEYFDELVSRSFIHRRSVDGEASFEIHDLINDLATTVSSSYCIRLEEQKLHKSVRHLSYNRTKHDAFNMFDTLHGVKGLRTFLALPLTTRWEERFCYLSNKVIDDLLPEMKQLRALSLSYYKSITKLPHSIGNLIYLRYLNLSCTDIERLPSTTCKLYNLQTLLLSDCRRLTELPEDIGNLANLRHLDITRSGLMRMPVQTAKLQNLQILSEFIVSKEQDGMKVVELRKFPHLQGKLTISGLENVTNPFDAGQANLKMKEKLEELTLIWRGFRNIDDPETERLVLEHLEPSTNLKKLEIMWYGGVSFPNWLGDSSFRNMVILKIRSCDRCSLLPPFGQLHYLKELYIEDMKSIKKVGDEFYGSSCSSTSSFQPFPSLWRLEFNSMPEWEEWKLIEGSRAIQFPSLKYLSLWFCPKLKGNLPCNLSSLTELKLSYCPLLLKSEYLDGKNNDIIRSPSYVFRQLMQPLNSLRELTLHGFPSLTSFPRDSLPKSLQSLIIDYCPNLEFLPDDCLHNSMLLEELAISNSCDSMTSLALGSLPVLKTLHLFNCKKLKSVLATKDDMMQSLPFLQSIKISLCNELESFCPGGLPTPNLIHLEVDNCWKLNSLPESIHTLTGLQELIIDRLPNLQPFAREGLPVNLRQLGVGYVGGVSSKTAIARWSLERLTCLSELKIKGDDIVNVLMNMIVSSLPTSLTYLRISDLKDIKCLDGRWLHHLTSLQKLQISYSLNLNFLPKEGLPSSLLALRIENCPLLEASILNKHGKERPKVARIPFIFINTIQVTI